MTANAWTAGDDGRWAALLARDARADGAFVYAVLSTAIYCRPSCPARRPRRENVRFYATPQQAEEAGFRPCKRCRPHGPAAEERYAETIARACRIIEEAEEPPALEALAAAVGMSAFHFHRTFKRIAGVTPKAYAAACRDARLREGLENSRTVTEAIYDAGFNASSRFYSRAAATLGMTPSQRRAGAPGETIRFAVGETSLGSVLVAATEKGICTIEMADDPEPLLEALQGRFPKAQLVAGDAEFEALVGRVLALVEAPETPAALPLDIRGTAFQQRVWQALRAIPAGATASYAEIAERIGAPKAVRGVAGACAANALAVAVPCHRVVRTDGGLGGYRWGIERKSALLARERKAGEAGARSG